MMLVLLLILHAAPAQAQNRVGNGGDVVACFEASKVKDVKPEDGKLATTRLLDFYESDHARVEPAANADYEAIIGERLEALKKKDAALGEQYLKRWSSMKAEVSFREGIALTEVDDSEHVFKPADKNCAVKQIALRKNAVAPGEARFVINKEYWDKLAPVDRAGLILHEVIYEHFYKLGEKNSVKARAFNARLFAKRFEADTTDDYWKFIGGLKVPLYRK